MEVVGLQKQAIAVSCIALVAIVAVFGVFALRDKPKVQQEQMESSSTPQPDNRQEELLEEALQTDVAALSREIIRLITETGAEEESIGKLAELSGTVQLLSHYFADENPPEALYLRDCAGIYQVLLRAYSGDVADQEGLLLLEEALAALVYPEQYQGELLPRFNENLEEDVRFAYTACVMNALHRQEQEAGIISITFAGDTTFGQYPEVPEELSFDTEFQARAGDLAFPLRITAPYFKNDSFSVLNCEGTFTTAEQMKQKRFRFKGPAEYIMMFVNGGVEVVNLANNHTYDYFEVGYEDTKRNLEAYSVEYYGEQEYLVYTIDDVAFGFFGYDLFGLEPNDMRQRLERDIAAVRELGAEVVIPTFHWGYEYYNNANSFQTQTAHLAVDLGADMVIGHHPHVLQGIEVYKGKTIIYSLGNFAFGGEELLVDGGDTMLVRQTFHRGEDGAVQPLALMVVPANTSTVTDRSNYVPRPLFGEDAQRVLERVLDFSAPLPHGVKELTYLGQTVARDA